MAADQQQTINIEVDGRSLKARPGAMLIEVTDEAGISIPRFCYHKKLSIAANCRMCLVEVANVPKPLPPTNRRRCSGSSGTYSASPRVTSMRR